ncbi:MAG: riboflavin biosynthesis protein RibF [Acidaminococcaceae bacterium]|nr:riboflavin biosynthesis protein RibF [Acidaminococcaceae bacterium]
MRILTKIDKLKKNIVLAVGTFDGLHLGHMKVIKTAVEIARQMGCEVGVLTFANHPLQYLNPALQPKQLLDRDDKQRILAAAGVDVLAEITFDKNFADLTAKDFLALMADKKIVVGEDFHFGKDREGSAKDFKDAVICPLVKVDDEIVSSSRIRHAISDGNLSLAEKLLGRPYTLAGTVQHGDERGRQLGFPTANLDIQQYELPPLGVYAGKVRTENKEYAGMVNLGNNPTFKMFQPRLEVHILDFQGDLYGKRIEVALLKYIRKQGAFAGAEQLQAQLQKDKEEILLAIK